MIAERLQIVITQEEIIHSKLPAIYMLMSKGLKTTGSLFPLPAGRITRWNDPATGNYHFIQEIQNEH